MSFALYVDDNEAIEANITSAMKKANVQTKKVLSALENIVDEACKFEMELETDQAMLGKF